VIQLRRGDCGSPSSSLSRIAAATAEDELGRGCGLVGTGFSLRRYGLRSQGRARTRLPVALAPRGSRRGLHGIRSDDADPATACRTCRLPLRSIESTFAADSTGFSTSRFVRWYDEKYGVQKSGREWVKAPHHDRGSRRTSSHTCIIEGPNAATAPLLKAAGRVHRCQWLQAGRRVRRQGVPVERDLDLITKARRDAVHPVQEATVNPARPGTLWSKIVWLLHDEPPEFLNRYH